MKRANNLIIIHFLLFSFFYYLISTRPIGPGFSEQGYGTVLQPTTNVGCSDSNQREYAGASVCFFEINGEDISLFCQIVHNVKGVTSVFLRGPNNGVLTFDPPKGLKQEQSFEVTFDFKTDFLNGFWQIFVQTEDCALGAIGGTFNTENNVFSIIEEFPFSDLIKNNIKDAELVGISVSNYNVADLSLSNFIVHLENVEKATIEEGGVESLYSRELFEFYSPNSPITETFGFISTRETDLYSVNQFYQLEKENQSNNRIRGEINVIDPIPDINFAFALNSYSLNSSSQYYYEFPSNAFGCALFYLDCENRLEYFVHHTVENPVNATVGLFAGAQNSIFSLNSAISPIFGKMKLSSTNAEKLRQGKFYLTIDSPEFPNGEIAGKINNKIAFYSYLNGFQVSPLASTTASKGCLLLDHPSNSSVPDLSLRIVHSVSDVTSLSFNLGKIGHSGEEISLFSQSFDYSSDYYSDNYYNSISVIDQLITITPNYIEDLIEGKIYVSISSSSFPEGEIRGQILQVIENCSYDPPPPRNQPEFFLSTGLFDDYFSTRKSSSSSASSLSPLYLFPFFCFITLIIIVV